VNFHPEEKRRLEKMVSSETLLFALSFGFLLCTVHSNALPQDPGQFFATFV